MGGGGGGSRRGEVGEEGINGRFGNGRTGGGGRRRERQTALKEHTRHVTATPQDKQTPDNPNQGSTSGTKFAQNPKGTAPCSYTVNRPTEGRKNKLASLILFFQL